MRVIVSCLQIVETGLVVVVIPTITNGVSFCQSLIPCDSGDCSPEIVGIRAERFSCGIYDTDNIAEDIVLIVIRGSVPFKTDKVERTVIREINRFFGKLGNQVMTFIEIFGCYSVNGLLLTEALIIITVGHGILSVLHRGKFSCGPGKGHTVIVLRRLSKSIIRDGSSVEGCQFIGPGTIVRVPLYGCLSVLCCLYGLEISIRIVGVFVHRCVCSSRFGYGVLSYVTSWVELYGIRLFPDTVLQGSCVGVP